MKEEDADYNKIVGIIVPIRIGSLIQEIMSRTLMKSVDSIAHVESFVTMGDRL